ncbi:MAG: PilZ domain-containing protein [Sandaracinaceae bacterium]|nr:PilZ domain-containing protein [Sandaracinaceae bacterium]
MDERRASERFPVWFPMTVVTDDGEEGTAITYDASAGGLLMGCAGVLAVGAHVVLRFTLGGEPAERAVGAHVVRVEEASDEAGPWRFRMAVEYDAPHPELEALIAAELAGHEG